MIERADGPRDMRGTFCRKLGCTNKPTLRIMQMICGLETYIYCCQEHKQWASEFLRDIDIKLRDILDAKIKEEKQQG